MRHFFSFLFHVLQRIGNRPENWRRFLPDFPAPINIDKCLHFPLVNPQHRTAIGHAEDLPEGSLRRGSDDPQVPQRDLHLHPAGPVWKVGAQPEPLCHGAGPVYAYHRGNRG